MEFEVPKNHPRYHSLYYRHLLERGLEEGVVVKTGLIAHGRGEAFDYLIGERTQSFARKAVEAAAALLLIADYPIVSVNGNVAALVPGEAVALAKELDTAVEVNLFYRTTERERVIYEKLKEIDSGMRILGGPGDATYKIPGLESNRGLVDPRGIARADVVLVPLEDGDRTEKLRDMGKNVITIDLNPLSRSARFADITIVDNIVRCLPLLTKKVRQLKHAGEEELVEIVNNYDNKKILKEALRFISERLSNMEL